MREDSCDVRSGYCEAISFFFFNDTATTEIYTLSLHDALPIYRPTSAAGTGDRERETPKRPETCPCCRDRKSTRLNSSHGYISYAVFCLKKKRNSGADSAARARRGR